MPPITSFPPTRPAKKMKLRNSTPGRTGSRDLVDARPPLPVDRPRNPEMVLEVAVAGPARVPVRPAQDRSETDREVPVLARSAGDVEASVRRSAAEDPDAVVV